MKTGQRLAADFPSAADAMPHAEAVAIAKDQNWKLELTKYTFDDNSVLAVSGPEVFGFDAADAASIRAYAEWLNADLLDPESREIQRLLDACGP
jgi:hypothetical protein